MKQKILVGVQVFLLITTITTGVIFANNAGSSEDPLVAKSYVDDKIDQVLGVINKTIGTTQNNNTQNDTQIQNNTQSDKNIFKPVLVQVGQTIYGKEGTEMILRSGKGNAVVSGAEGIANITTGVELRNKSTVSKNHFLIIPRDDKRGIKVTEKAWFLVKGDYEIN